MIRQADVTAFYDRLTFPSKTSHPAYAALVPATLQGRRVGDFGCGQSLFRETLRRLGCEALFLDIAPSALRAQDYGMRLQASLTAIPLGDDTMDAIFCIGVVHHVPELELALEEIVRVLRPGGALYLGVYAPWSVQACLRKTYDRTASRLARALIERVTGALIWTRNRRNGLRYRSADYTPECSCGSLGVFLAAVAVGCVAVKASNALNRKGHISGRQLCRSSP